MGWVSPTGFVDPSSEWTDESNTYDENTGTYAKDDAIPASTWSAWLELTHSSIQCDKVRLWSAGYKIDNIQVDVYYNTQWNNIYNGSHTKSQWVEYSIGSTESVTAMRVRGENVDTGNIRHFFVYEADFNEVVSIEYENAVAMGCNF